MHDYPGENRGTVPEAFTRVEHAAPAAGLSSRALSAVLTGNSLRPFYRDTFSTEASLTSLRIFLQFVVLFENHRTMMHPVHIERSRRYIDLLPSSSCIVMSLGDIQDFARVCIGFSFSPIAASLKLLKSKRFVGEWRIRDAVRAYRNPSCRGCLARACLMLGEEATSAGK